MAQQPPPALLGNGASVDSRDDVNDSAAAGWEAEQAFPAFPGHEGGAPGGGSDSVPFLGPTGAAAAQRGADPVDGWSPEQVGFATFPDAGGAVADAAHPASAESHVAASTVSAAERTVAASTIGAAERPIAASTVGAAASSNRSAAVAGRQLQPPPPPQFETLRLAAMGSGCDEPPRRSRSPDSDRRRSPARPRGEREREQEAQAATPVDARRSDNSGMAGPAGSPIQLNNPDDLTDQLPPGRVKLLAFVMVFLLWVGGWGALDVVVELLAGENTAIQLLIYLVITATGAVSLKVVARRYRGYAFLDEIREMEEAVSGEQR